TDLLENGFKRYFWKSVFGTSLDGLAMQAALTDQPTHLFDSVCGPGRAAARAAVAKSKSGGTKKKYVKKKSSGSVATTR
ncbi:MAG TPA: hypothetical protein VIG52_04235, partial [Methyloceanibacter sp.]